jgi:hypothetical protein
MSPPVVFGCWSLRAGFHLTRHRGTLQANFHSWIAFYRHVKGYDWFWEMLQATTDETDAAAMQKLEASGKDVVADVAVGKPNVK